MCFKTDVEASLWRSKLTSACADAADSAATASASKKMILSSVVDAVALPVLKTMAFRAHVTVGSEQHRWQALCHTSHVKRLTSHVTQPFMHAYVSILDYFGVH